MLSGFNSWFLCRLLMIFPLTTFSCPHCIMSDKRLASYRLFGALPSGAGFSPHRRSLSSRNASKFWCDDRIFFRRSAPVSGTFHGRPTFLPPVPKSHLCQSRESKMDPACRARPAPPGTSRSGCDVFQRQIDNALRRFCRRTSCFSFLDAFKMSESRYKEVRPPPRRFHFSRPCDKVSVLKTEAC